MALDETTGLFNFYIIERPEPLHPHDRATVTRFIRRADGTDRALAEGRQPPRHDRGEHESQVLRLPHQRRARDERGSRSRGRAGSARPASIRVAPSPGSRVSSWSELASLLARARPLVARERSEKITREAIATSDRGPPPAARLGRRATDASGQQPGGVSGLLKSVFCQTELNRLRVPTRCRSSSSSTSSRGQFAALEPPINSLSLPHFPVRLPVRSEVDKRIEIFLQKKGPHRSRYGLATPPRRRRARHLLHEALRPLFVGRRAHRRRRHPDAAARRHQDHAVEHAERPRAPHRRAPRSEDARRRPLAGRVRLHRGPHQRATRPTS